MQLTPIGRSTPFKSRRCRGGGWPRSGCWRHAEFPNGATCNPWAVARWSAATRRPLAADVRSQAIGGSGLNEWHATIAYCLLPQRAQPPRGPAARGGEEEQGVRAHARGPRPVIRFGREERPARPPPTAARRLAGLATMPCGVSETGFAAIRTPLSPSVRRGNRWNRGQTACAEAVALPRRWREGSDPGTPGPALGWSGRHAGRGIGLQPSAPS